MAEDALALWGRMTYQERLYVLGQQFPDGIPPDALERLLVDEIKRQYGYLASYLDHPEIGPILRQAGQQGWTQERLQAELYKTTWWQNTSSAQREWDLLARSDPAEARRRQEELATKIEIMGSQAGLTQYTRDHYMYMAQLALSKGQSDEEIRQGLFAHQQFQGTTPTGTLGSGMNQVKARANDYGLPISDEAAFEWSRQIAAGLQTQEGIDAYLREQAKSRYSWLAEDLDRGATVRQLFDPMIQQTAQLLEISPSQIDLADPKFSGLIDHVDEHGTRRSMTLAEAATAIRRTDEWQQTENAQQAASNAAESLLRTFGKVDA